MSNSNKPIPAPLPIPLPIPPSPSPSPSPSLPMGGYDQYGCLPSAGYYFSPSSSSCCKCTGCDEPPRPWVCDPSELSATGSMDPFGCKKPGQVYDYQTGGCCNCECIMPNGNPNQS